MHHYRPLAIIVCAFALGCGGQASAAGLGRAAELPLLEQGHPSAENHTSAEGDAPSPEHHGGANATSQASASEEVPRASDLQSQWEGRPAERTLRGRASYYSDRLAGRHTANGDIYRIELFTAASRDLPFGTIVRVTRIDSGRSVVVRVNDRGPFGDHSRILDLSRAAAESLDMIRAGVVSIRAEILHTP